MRRLKGIRKRGNKYQAFVRVNGEFRQQMFDTLDVPEIRTWQEAQRTTAPAAPAKGTLAATAAEYFAKPEVAAQPYVAQKQAHILLWLDALGRDVEIDTITRDQVEAVLQDWLKTFAPATVCHRRLSLLAVFTHAYG